jgi:hypothetical protein
VTSIVTFYGYLTVNRTKEKAKSIIWLCQKQLSPQLMSPALSSSPPLVASSKFQAPSQDTTLFWNTVFQIVGSWKRADTTLSKGPSLVY